MASTIQIDTDRMILHSRYLPSELLNKPALDIAEQAALAGIPVSSLERIYMQEGGPRMFTLGRHRKALKEDFLTWLERRAETHPYRRGPARNPNGRRGNTESE